MFPGFTHPFSCVIAGPSQSGKTVFLRKLLKGVHLFVDKPPENIIWCYGVQNDEQINSIKQSVNVPIEFVEGLPDLNAFSLNQRNLLILDDLMADAGKNSEVASLFTKHCHHKNISVILVLQNLYHKASQMRDIHTSCNFLIIFKNPRDNAQIRYLEHQCFPEWKNYLTQAYAIACSRPYGYLAIDLMQTTPNDRRLMTGFFFPETFFYFIPKQVKKH